MGSRAGRAHNTPTVSTMNVRALFSAIGSGQAYLNIHTTAVPSGEIRAFLIAVPEMGTWAMMLVGFGAIGFVMRRRPALFARA